MTYSISGSHAENVSVLTMTQQQFADEYGGDEPLDPDEKIVVLVDVGNQLAYVLEGDVSAVATWLQGAADDLAVEDSLDA